LQKVQILWREFFRCFLRNNLGDPVTSLFISDAEWKVVSDFTAFLAPLCFVTNALSKENEPTIQLVLPSYILLKSSFGASSSSMSTSVSRASAASLRKLQKYFQIADSNCYYFATGKYVFLFCFILKL
jgi:hypothetical protein